MFADIMDNFSSVCELLEIQPGHYTHFYQELKVNNRLYNIGKHISKMNIPKIYRKT